MIRRPIRRRGMLSYASLFVILMLLMLIATVWNAARVPHRKLEAQNAADAAAQAAGVEAARSMNELTATNHLIGELMAVCVLAYTPGGTELEEGTAFAYERGTTSELAAAFAAAELSALVSGVPPYAPAYHKAGGSASASGAAIGHARQRLKQVLAAAYRKHVTGPAGALPIQKTVEAEWDTLDRLEVTARTTLLPLKQLCNHTLIRELYAHARRIVERTPVRMETAAAHTGRLHDASGTLFPNTSGRGPSLELPVVTEKEVVAVAGWEKSQMVRAATPWVQFWRKPVLAYAARHLPLSEYAAFYLDWSNTFTVNMARWQGEDYETYLYVLKDTRTGGRDKGYEPWTARIGSLRADELFAFVGFAHMPAPKVFGPGLFKQTQPDGMAAFTQVALYNANPQDPTRPPPAPRTAADWQPVVGWDTLNWSPEVRVPEFRFGREPDERDLIQQPRVLVNWRAKLAPVTRLADAAPHLDGPLGAIIARTTLDWPSNTH